METNTVQTVTLTNSIIGVGILSMPFCFQKCGIVLSIVLLLLSSYVTRLVCSYMVKSAIISRRKNFEQIAFYAFGSGGKLLVELCVVGYLLGTCVAYFVVVGDLGPQITAKILSLDESYSLRSWVMIVVTIVCIIPLGMLRNVDSLASVCSASLGFYLCMVLKVVSEASVKFQQTDWFDRLDLWKWSGILQCMPIFTMALSCQMQIFEVYATMPTTSLDKMSRVIRQSTNICTMIYVAIGFFGYVAFNGHRFSGNILVDFSPSFASDIIKMGFVLSVAFSFPLAIFPCRVSLYSLLYKRTSDAHFYIPESKFRPLTVAIVLVALIVGLLIPSIEVVIGLVGSTIGVAICLIIPAACYMTICKTNISEKQLAQVMIVFGFLTMVLGTYANLQAIDSTPEKKYESTTTTLAVILDKLAINPPDDTLRAVESFKLPPAPDKLPVEKSPVSDTKVIPKMNPVVDVPEQTTATAKESKPLSGKDPSPEVQLVPLPTEAPRVAINNEAILKEDREIAAEEKEKIVKEITELQNAKKVLEAEVENIKEELVKKNKETEQLVLKKLDEIVEKIAEQSAGKASREENPEPAGEQAKPPRPSKRDPAKGPSDPIVKLLTASGSNKTVPAAVEANLTMKNGSNFLEQPSDQHRLDHGPWIDVYRLPAEGAGGGELPTEQGVKQTDNESNALRKEEQHKDGAQSRNVEAPKKSAPSQAMEGVQQVPVAQTKTQHAEKKQSKESVPLPPLPVEEMPVERKVGATEERKSKDGEDVAAGKRDLLAMRFKREAENKNATESDNCPKLSVQEGAVAQDGDLSVEKDGFR
ncbi:putative sodium-coupled neutral amino acid transporter 10 [Anopheles bellator]|uniref:putative sodium-coupled neutral amino acid transporter 10 n=1 Tax=Anopheles bellator TaxID=139047 RepID=UPI0026497D8B|nr:putative sodium-coupled neutral amino acid transporter 10 [Anopheles bellator]